MNKLMYSRSSFAGPFDTENSSGDGNMPLSVPEIITSLEHTNPHDHGLVDFNDAREALPSSSFSESSLGKLATLVRNESIPVTSPSKHESFSALHLLAPIHLAALYNDQATAEVLLDQGADLHAAASITFEKLPSSLVGSAMNQTAVVTFTALELAICRRRNANIKTAMFLLERNSSSLVLPRHLSSTRSALYLACTDGRLDMVQAILNRVRNESDLEASSGIQLGLAIPNFALLHTLSRNHQWGVLRIISKISKASYDFWPREVTLTLRLLLGRLVHQNEIWQCFCLLRIFDFPGSGLAAFAVNQICSAAENALYGAGQDLLFLLDYLLSACRHEDFLPKGFCAMALAKTTEWCIISNRKPGLSGVFMDKIVKRGVSFGLPVLVVPDPNAIKALVSSSASAEIPALAVGKVYLPLDAALYMVRATTQWPRALRRFQQMLTDYPPLQDAYSVDATYLHELGDSWFCSLRRHVSLDHIPLVTVARQLILSGWGVEEKHRKTGETVLMHLFSCIRSRNVESRSLLDKRMFPFCVDEMIFLLACLQRCGAKLETANDSTTMQIIFQSVPIRHPEDPSLTEYLISRASRADRPDSFLQRLCRAIQVRTTADGSKTMMFHRPRLVPKDLPGDEGFIESLLADDGIWFDCACKPVEMCLGDWCTTGSDPDAAQDMYTRAKKATEGETCAWSIRAMDLPGSPVRQTS